MRRIALLSLLLTLFAGGVLAQTREKPTPLPAGVYDFEASAAPTELQQGEPLTLTLRIIATDPKSEEPRRPNLNDLARGQLAPGKLTDLFDLEIPGGREPKRPKQDVWEFTYLLRPKSTKVQSIPALKFSFLEGRARRQRLSESIPLIVNPPTPAQLPRPGKILAPPGAFEMVSGAAVLRRETASWWFTAPALTLLILTPPLFCAGWYLLWRRLHPDALRLLQRRHARAMRQAIQTLKRAADPGGTVTATVVARYLQQRFDFAVVEPTPAEVMQCLQQAGASAEMVQKGAGLFKACDGARFTPAGAEAALAAEAIHFIQTLETDLCVARSS